MAASTAGSYSLGGSVLDHDALDASDFSADPSETTVTDIGVTVALDVLAGGEVEVSAIAETAAQIEVSSTAVAVSAEITGSGDIEIAV